MEENVFPSAMALYDLSDDEIEEERRLCYVAITRAMKNLTLTCAVQRMKNGQPNINFPSLLYQRDPSLSAKADTGCRHTAACELTPFDRPHCHIRRHFLAGKNILQRVKKSIRGKSLYPKRSQEAGDKRHSGLR